MEIVVAADNRNGIGKDGKLPWHLPMDLQRFKHLTMGKTVIMGRRTWDSLPDKFRPLPGRRNVVLTRDEGLAELLASKGVGFSRAGLQVVPMIEKPPYMVIGGASVYREALELGVVDTIHLTRVFGDFACDTFWPGVPSGWVKVWDLPAPDIRPYLGAPMPPMCVFERWEKQ